MSEEFIQQDIRGRRLTLVVGAILFALEAYFFTTANVRSDLHLQLGMLMIALAFTPALFWARRGKPTLPVFELLILTTANTYAFPLLNGHEELLRYPIDTVTSTALQVILFQASAILIHRLVPADFGISAFWREEAISPQVSRWLGHGLTLSTSYTLVSIFTNWIPDSLASVLRAAFFGLGIIATFLTSRRLGQGQLSAAATALFLTNIVVQCVATSATLLLVNAISLILLALVGYISASGRIPIILSCLTLTVLAILHNGKSDMRALYWTHNERITPSFSKLPDFYSEWVTFGLTFDSTNGRQKAANKLIDRTSLMHILCLVVSTSPDSQPYLEGDTYFDIPAQFVPRILWPEKPLAHVSTSRLSVYYGLQVEEETAQTTIGFGMLAEAYANFGTFGVLGLAGFLAFSLKKIASLAEDGPMLSYGGILLVILLAWSFQVEFTMSIWLSSLFQACVAVFGLPFLARRFFN